MTRAIILGSGTSNGVPMLGYEYPPGYLDNPKNHRTRCSLLLQGPTGNVLIDCAPEMRLQLTGARIYDLEAVIITHTHADHVMGMDDLRSICIKTGLPMPVYTLPRYQEDIRRIFAYAFEEFPPGVMVPRFDLRDVEPVLALGGMEIAVFEVAHGRIPCLGVRVDGFAYITDVSAIPEGVWPLLAGLDTLVLDAVRLRPHPNHFHFEAALEVAARIGARQTYLTHLSHDYDHDVTNTKLPPGVELAYDGQQIDVRVR